MWAIGLKVCGCSNDVSGKYFPKSRTGHRTVYDVELGVLGNVQKATMVLSDDGSETINGKDYPDHNGFFRTAGCATDAVV